MTKMSVTQLFIACFVIFSLRAPPVSADLGVADPINKYSDFQTFGRVMVRCPIEKTWETVGNAEKWFRAVIGVV